MFIAFDQLFQLASADEVAVPGADDEAACPLGGLAGLHDTVLAPAFESLLLSARGPAPMFIFDSGPSVILKFFGFISTFS